MNTKSQIFPLPGRFNIFIFTLLLIFPALVLFSQSPPINPLDQKEKVGATSLGSKAYFAGGVHCFGNFPMASLEIYDTETGQWDFSQELSVPRSLPAVVSCDNKVFFAGGKINWSEVDFSEVDIYDVVTGRWSVGHLSVPRVTSAVAKGNTVLFAGGLRHNFSMVVDIVDIYNTETQEWSTATLSEPRDARAAVVVGNYAMFAGGWAGKTMSKRVDIYNFTTGEWSIDSLSEARAFIGAASVGDKAIFAGGMTAENTRSYTIDIFDVSDSTWTTASLSSPRAFMGAINAGTVGNKAYFVGGGKMDIYTGLVSNLWTCDSRVIDIYDATTDSWSFSYLPGFLVSHGVAGTDSVLVVAGGLPCHSTVNLITRVDAPSHTESVIDYSLFPNPVNTMLNIHISFERKTGGTLKLFDISGNTLFQKSFEIKEFKETLDLSTYPPGLYLIEIDHGTGRIIEKVAVYK